MITCRNGHQQPVSAAKFCIHCGAALDAPQWNHPTAQPQSPPAAQPNGQQVAQTSQQYPPQQTAVQNFQPHRPNSPPLAQNYQPSLLPQTAYYPPPPVQPPRPVSCYTCGGDGQGLAEGSVVCKECAWLRPLAPGYRIDSSAFAWAADGKAMAALRAVKPLNSAATAVSERMGRRWIESTFNGVLLGERQLPHIYWQAVRAARLLGMSHMPDVYISGEQAWDCLTFGTDKDSFVVIGSAVAGSFKGDDLLFLLAREMGHCRAGHALWKSVIRFLLGHQGPAKGFMAGGLLSALMSPTAMIEGAIEMPLLAWARQAEITADRAGMLAVGDERIARRVLLTWSLKSVFMYRQINIEAWIEQQADDDEDNYSKLSELTTTSTPYLTPRLKLLGDFARSPELAYWRQTIADAEARLDAQAQAAPQALPEPAKPAETARPANTTKTSKQSKQSKAAAPATDAVKLKCATCEAPMRIPREVLAGKTELPVKCPQCGKVTRLRKNVKPAASASAAPPKPTPDQEAMIHDD